MTAKQCTGNGANGVPTPKDSGIYCEGRQAAFEGVLKTANPHPATTRDADLWDDGWDSHSAGVGTALPLDCCAMPGYDGVP